MISKIKTLAGIPTNPDNIESEFENDQVIIRQVLSGDQNAFAQLVSRYQVIVYNLCMRMLHNQAEAEDAVQEVFIRAYQQLHTYEMARKFSTWLLSITSHYCIDILRKRRPSLDLDQILFWKTSQDPEPEESFINGEERDEIRLLLNKLPGIYRQVVILKYWYDFSYEEIARAADISVSNVKSRLFRAREMLAKELAGNQTAEKTEKTKKTKSRRAATSPTRASLKGQLLPWQHNRVAFN